MANEEIAQNDLFRTPFVTMLSTPLNDYTLHFYLQRISKFLLRVYKVIYLQTCFMWVRVYTGEEL